MASLSGWIFVVIGGGVAAWSYSRDSLLFFTIIGAVMILYGISKIIFAAAFKKSEIKPDREKSALSGERNHAHAQMQAHNYAQTQQTMQTTHMHSHHQTNLSNPKISPPPINMPKKATNHGQQTTHHQMQRSSLNQAQTAYKICPNCKKHMHVTYRFCPHCGWGV